MKGITKYVLWQLLVGMILVTAGLTCVIWLSQSLRFVEMIINRGLPVGTFTYLTMLLLPNFLSIIMPFALFTVVVFTYNKLITDRELVIMRSAGLSQISLAKQALILAFAVLLVGYALTLYLLPTSYRMFREMQWDIRYNYSRILLREGAFNIISDDVTVYVRKRTGDGQLHGILVHDVRKKDKPLTVMAERGAVIDADGYARVVMFNGNRQKIDKKTRNLSILYFDKYAFDLVNKKVDSGIRYREARERMPLELLNIEKEKLMNKKDYGKFIVEGHNRFVSPLSALTFTLVGLACLISGSITRRGQTRRVVAAVGIVVLLQAAAMGLQNLSARDFRWIPLMYVNAFLPMLLAHWYMLHPPRRRRSGTGARLATAT